MTELLNRVDAWETVTTPPCEIAVILNPAAQSARASRHVAAVRQMSEGARLCETRAAGDARRLARELAGQRFAIVVAAGGDGTINEVVTGLLEADVASPPALGVLPLGTMNVLACELGLPVTSLPRCWERIAAGGARELDVWQAGARRFVQMAGVGLDASVIRQTTWAAKKRWGPLSYLGTLADLLDRPPAVVRVSVDGGPPVMGSTVLIGNGRFYGGPFIVFPGAANDDGLIDVNVIHGHGPAAFTGLVADVLMKEIDENHEGVTRLRGRQVAVEADSPLPFEVDGELGGETPVEITRHPRRLRVVV